MDAPTVAMLTTVAGLALVTGLIVGVVRTVGNLSGPTMDRFGALISIIVAIILAVLASAVLNLVSGTTLLQDGLNGLVAGLAASGGYDVLNGAQKALAANKQP